MTPISDLHPIAQSVVEARPDWEIGHVLTVLCGVREKGDTNQVRVAAMRAATDPNTRAPVAITWPVFWAPKRSTTNSFVPANPLPECRRCAHPAKRGVQLDYCAGCGQVWEPIHFRPDYANDRANAVPCPPHLRAILRGIA